MLVLKHYDATCKNSTTLKCIYIDNLWNNSRTKNVIKSNFYDGSVTNNAFAKIQGSLGKEFKWTILGHFHLVGKIKIFYLNHHLYCYLGYFYYFGHKTTVWLLLLFFLMKILRFH